MIFTPYQEQLIHSLILLALAEDIGSGDHTTLATVPQNSTQ